MSTRWRILLFNTAHRWIGEAAGTDLLARVLHERGHEVRVAVPRGGRIHESLAKTAPYALEPVAWRLPFGGSGNVVSQHAECLRLLRSYKPEILHCGRGKEHWLAALLRPLACPAAAIVRTRHVALPFSQGAANRWLFRSGTDAVTAVSSVAFAGLGTLGEHLPPERRRLVLGAVDSRVYSPSRRSDSLRAELGVTAERTRLVGCLGRLQHVKGYDTFLRAIARVATARGDVQGVLSGRRVDSDHPKIVKMEAELSLGDRVAYRGMVEDPAALIASLDVGVIASRGSEGFSRIAVEYMASGVPIVATTVGAIPEILRDGELGLLVPPEDDAAMADAILSLLADPARAHAMAERALAAVAPRFSPDRLGAEIEDVYRAAVAARESAR